MTTEQLDNNCYAVNVAQACPNLQFDDDGLLMVDASTSLDESYVHYDPKCHIHYSPLFKNFGLDVHRGFTHQLVQYFSTNKRITRFGIRLDMSQICERPIYYVERQLFRGPSGISIEQLQDPRFPENKSGTVTEHVSDEFDEKVQVMWSARGDEKTVQIEEIQAISPESSKREYKTRYIHAIWNTAAKSFIHFDGAIKYYAASQYALRWDASLKAQDHHLSEKKEKLFRLDGNVDLKAWCNFTALFFRWNWLVEEYLCGEDKSALEELRRVSDLDKMVRKLMHNAK